MQLRDRCGRFFRRAWSVRVLVGGGIVNGVVMGLPALADVIPPYWFMFACVLATIVATLFAQSLHQDDLAP